MKFLKIEHQWFIQYYNVVYSWYQFVAYLFNMKSYWWTTNFVFNLNVLCKQCFMGICKGQNEIETKRNETKPNETKRNQTKRNETDRKETISNETKRNDVAFRFVSFGFVSLCLVSFRFVSFLFRVALYMYPLLTVGLVRLKS